MQAVQVAATLAKSDKFQALPAHIQDKDLSHKVQQKRQHIDNLEKAAKAGVQKGSLEEKKKSERMMRVDSMADLGLRSGSVKRQRRQKALWNRFRVNYEETKSSLRSRRIARSRSVANKSRGTRGGTSSLASAFRTEWSLRLPIVARERSAGCAAVPFATKVA